MVVNNLNADFLIYIPKNFKKYFLNYFPNYIFYFRELKMV